MQVDTMNETTDKHYVLDLSGVSTADLVRELCSRDNVSALRLAAGESCGEPRPRIHGPSLVIVVRGDE